MSAKLPEAIFWLADPVLSKVRANQLEVKKGDGDSGPRGAIRMLQEVLLVWGLQVRKPAGNLLPQYGADGDFGSETKDALITFQKANTDSDGNPLAPDGILGDLTLGALDKLLIAPVRPDEPIPEDDDDAVIPLHVDVIAFPDGPKASQCNQMFPAAREVFKRMNIDIRPGKILRGFKSEEEKTVARLARAVFETNQPRGKTPGASHSRISGPTAIGRTLTAEVARLQARTNSNRITACLVDQFPTSVGYAAGVTFTRKQFKKAPTVFVAKSYDCMEVFWHELCHALLDTTIDDEDHVFETITEKRPTVESRQKAIDDDQLKAMRATARTLD